MEGRGRAGWIHGGWRLVYGALAWGEMGRRGDEGGGGGGSSACDKAFKMNQNPESCG